MNQLTLSFKKRRQLNYFNTVGESPDKVRVYEAVNRAQEEMIYQFLKSRDRVEGWTSWELFEQLKTVPEFSVKRALNVLMNAEPKQLAYQTGERRNGGRGRSCLVWRSTTPK